MRALLVEDSLNFQRGKSPLSSMGVGGFSFDTLKPGAILISKRYFGVTEKTGKITGYNSAKLPIGKDNFLLVTEIRDNADGKTKNISFKRYSSHGFTLEKIKEERQKLRDSGRKSLEWWGILSGFFSAISKAKFNFRFDILVPGFNDLNESISFERGKDPKDSMKIGLGPFKYIEEFEKILDDLHLLVEKQGDGEFDRNLEWILVDDEFGNFNSEVIFLDREKGWSFSLYSKNYFSDPYEILEYLIKSVYDSLEDELSGSKMRVMQLESRISDIDQTLKKMES
jgi:hypothetical protein